MKSDNFSKLGFTSSPENNVCLDITAENYAQGRAFLTMQ